MARLTVVEPPPAGGASPTGRSSPPPNPNFGKPQPNAEAVTEKVGFELERVTLDEGVVLFQWPEFLTKDSFEELEYWLKGILRRGRRKAGIQEKASASE